MEKIRRALISVSDKKNLRYLLKTLQKFKPAIYCEITRKTNKIINLLKTYGYEFFAISNEEKHKLKKNFYANVLALHKNSSLKKI